MTMRRLAVLGSVLAPLAVFAGCGVAATAVPVTDSGLPPFPSGDASSTMAAWMNDVSILFPLPASAADVDNLLAPSAIGDGGPLFPNEVYANMGLVEGSTPVGVDAGVPVPPFANPAFFPDVAAYRDLRVVAMRIDPCFASLDPAPSGVGCTAQLRLVFQEVRWVPDAGAAVFDSAIHAFYDLSRAQFLALARALVDLRGQNENGDVPGPLAPHPIMVRQGLAGPMSQGVQRLILEFAGAQNLVRSAESSFVFQDCSTGCGSGAWDWGMSGFDLTGLAAAIPRAIPTLIGPDGGSVVAQAITFSDFGLQAGPTTTANDNLTALYNPGSGSLPPSPAIQAAFDALVRIENPRDESPDTIDCAGCHLTTQSEKTVAGPVFSLDDTSSPLSYLPEGTTVTRGDLQATFNLAGSSVNIHAFSYLGGFTASGALNTAPTISQRVVNETAAVVAYLNALAP